MRYDLADLVRRTSNPRRSTIPIRPINPPATLAANLYRSSYAPLIAGIAQVAEAIIREYERTTVALVTDSAADIRDTLGEGGSFLDRLVLSLLPSLKDWAVVVEKWHRGRWRGAVLTATGVDLDTLLTIGGEPTSVETYIAWNTALVKDVSAQAQARIGNAVFAGLRDRLPARDVAKTIRESIAMSRRRSIGIASDQLSKLTSALDRERRTEAGITAFKWRWSHKQHGRPEHIARDGKRFTEDDAPKDRAGTLPFCGCRESALLELS